MNKLLYVYFTEWTKNEHFLRKLKKIFYIIFNEDPSEVVEEIIIRNVSVTAPGRSSRAIPKAVLPFTSPWLVRGQ